MINIKREIYKNKYKLLSLFLLIIFIIISLLSFYKQVIYTGSQSLREIITNNIEEEEISTIAPFKNIRQTFRLNADKFSAIGLKVFTFDRVNTGVMIVELWNKKENSLIKKWELDTAYCINNEYNSFYLDNPIETNQNNEYEIVISAMQSNINNSIALVTSNKDTYLDGICTIDEQIQEFDLDFQVFDKPYGFIVNIFLGFSIIFIIAICILFYFIFIYKKLVIEKVFLASILFWGIIYSFVLCPFSAPDEITHFVQAYNYSNIILGNNNKEVIDNKTYINIRLKDKIEEWFKINPTLNTYKYIYDNINSNKKEEKEKAVFPYELSDISYGAFAYLPASIGVTIARIFNLNAVQLHYFGRFGMLLFYAILTYFAIKKLPFGKMTFLAISMLPMVLELVSSYSYDAVINALAYMYIAYCLYLIYDKEKITYKDIAILVILIVWLSPCKIIYSFLGLLCLLIPKIKFPNKRSYYIMFLAMLIGIVGINVVMNLNVIFNISGQSNEIKIIEWAQEPGYTIHYLLNNPIKIISIYLRTLQEYLDFYIISIIGGLLGWLRIPVSNMLLLGFITILLASTVKIENSTEKVISIKHKIIYIGISTVIFCLVLLSMLLAWTPLSSNTILGVQGRYFLPILPIALLICRTNGIKLAKNIDSYLIMTLYILNLFTIMEVLKYVIL